jgi:hypothetical protein
MFHFIAWLMALLGFQRADIARPGISAYLTRWTLWGRRQTPGKAKLFLHCFHASNPEPYTHDHPWSFWSLILAGGYFEHTGGRRFWRGPLRLLRMPADHQHRVELPKGRKSWSLVWTGPRTRSWGFVCPGRGWIPWRRHQYNMNAGRSGCADE